MGISSIGGQNYSQAYQSSMSHQKSQSSNGVSLFSENTSNITLHFLDKKTGDDAETCVGFANGVSASVFKSDSNSDSEYQVKYWGKDGVEQEMTVDAKNVDPSNASFLEMMAYSTYSDEQGKTSDAYGDFLLAAGGTNATLTYDLSNINTKADFKSLTKDFMDLQYSAGNLPGYLSLKQFYDSMDEEDAIKNSTNNE